MTTQHRSNCLMAPVELVEVRYSCSHGARNPTHTLCSHFLKEFTNLAYDIRTTQHLANRDKAHHKGSREGRNGKLSLHHWGTSRQAS